MMKTVAREMSFIVRLQDETVSSSINFMQRNEKKAAIMIAAEVVSSENLSPHMSENQPRTVGEIASPRACMKKMFTAKAMVRTDGLVTFTITVFSGPVLRNRKNSARNIAPMQWESDGVRSA